ncbi:MAG: TonB family protein [Gemmatimonadaceae bacterium]|nr:TonB family protein [Gemmatimonadaceae bacterium]
MISAPFDLTTWMFAATAFGVLLIVAAFAVERFQRIRARSTRGVWAVALSVAVMWPGVARLWLTQPAVEVADGVGAPIIGAMTPVSTPVSLSIRQQLLEWWSSHGNTVLLALWLGMSALLFSQLLRALWQLRRAAADAHTTELVGEPVLVSESLGPAVFGVWRPRVVVPRWVLELDESLQQLVIRHEREHCDGRDSWLVWLAVLSTTLVPWNLAVWYLAHRLRLAMEVDCDARTLRAFPERRTAYARLLLFIAQRATPVRIAPALAHWPSHLSRRISAMTNASFALPLLQRTIAGIVVIGAAAAACSRPVAGNLAGPAPAPKVASTAAPSAAPAAAPTVAPSVAPAPSPASPRELSAADSATRASVPWFDFQVEKPATMKPGMRGPRYPDALRAAKTEGAVLAQFVVGTDGRVDLTTYKAVKSDHDDFSAAVKDALGVMEFEPAQVKGKAVKQLVQMPFAFALSKDPVSAASPSPLPSPSMAAVDREASMLPTTSPAPVYPAALREARVEGQVLVMVVVNDDGSPDMASFKVLKTDRDEFAEAVREAVQNTRWTPAMKDGRAVRQLVRYPYAFRLAK